MQLSPSQIKTIRHQFDALCRKVLREESRNIEKIRLRRLEREICFTGLSEYERKKLLVMDEYSFESTYFQVMDQSGGDRIFGEGKATDYFAFLLF